jgi:hypothetical protein
VLRRLTHQQWLAGRGGVGVGEGVQGNVHLRPIRPWFRPWQPGKKRGWKTSLTMEKQMLFSGSMLIYQRVCIYTCICDYMCFHDFEWLYYFRNEMIWYDHRWAISRTHFFFLNGIPSDTWGIAIIFSHHLFSIILYWDDLGWHIGDHWISLDSRFCLVVDVQVLIGGGSQSHQL